LIRIENLEFISKI